MRKLNIVIINTLILFQFVAAQVKIPAVYSNMSINKDKDLVLKIDTHQIVVKTIEPVYTAEHFDHAWEGGKDGLVFNSAKKNLTGTMYFGLIHYSDSKHPHPVFRKSVSIRKGKSAIDIGKILSGRYDMVGWEKAGKGVLGYRVLNTRGTIIYNGVIGFTYKDKFSVDLTILEGPFINLLTSSGTTISFRTNKKAVASVVVNGKEFKSKKSTFDHEISITGLQPNTKYEYTVKYENNTLIYSFETAPKKGSRKPFAFGYASDCRGGVGGGERNVYGHNAYVLKKIMALSAVKNLKFLQFTGDIIGGYSINKEDIQIQYTNFKRTISPFSCYYPLIVGMGNHESLLHTFTDPKIDLWMSVDKFPFETESSEYIFGKNFVNPLNGPESEDGSKYDPSKKNIDFPSYKENVFFYTYDNVAIVVLNSDYFYAPSTEDVPITSGNIHGYIMDNQLEWLKKTLNKFEDDEHIDHVFVTVHTPAFPNGGHVDDDMYYGGDNSYRPYIAGKPVKKGIIERRDEILNILINQNKKTVALLTGDEHNYAKLKLESETPIYPENYPNKKIKLKRTFWQINNGAAGAPYYAQEKTPWSDWVSGFTTQNALVLFYIDGKSVKMKVFNPDTLELVDELTLR